MTGAGVIIDAPGLIIAVRDSLTAGSQPGVTEYAPYADATHWKPQPTSYPFILGKILYGNDCPDLVLNLGMGGSTTRDWLPGMNWEKSGVRI